MENRSLLVAFSEQGPLTIMSTSVFPIENKVYEVPANSILFIATSEFTGIPKSPEYMADNYQFLVNHSRNHFLSPSLIRWEKEIFTSENEENGNFKFNIWFRA